MKLFNRSSALYFYIFQMLHNLALLVLLLMLLLMLLPLLVPCGVWECGVILWASAFYHCIFIVWNSISLTIILNVNDSLYFMLSMKIGFPSHHGTSTYTHTHTNPYTQIHHQVKTAKKRFKPLPKHKWNQNKKKDKWKILQNK